MFDKWAIMLDLETHAGFLSYHARNPGEKTRKKFVKQDQQENATIKALREIQPLTWWVIRACWSMTCHFQHYSTFPLQKASLGEANLFTGCLCNALAEGDEPIQSCLYVTFETAITLSQKGGSGQTSEPVKIMWSACNSFHVYKGTCSLLFQPRGGHSGLSMHFGSFHSRVAEKCGCSGLNKILPWKD